MIAFGILGIVAIVLGILYLFIPTAITKLDNYGKTIIITAEKLMKHRIITGLFYLIAGIILTYIGFFWFK